MEILGVNLADAAVGAGIGGPIALGAFIGATRATLKYIKATLKEIKSGIGTIGDKLSNHEARIIRLEESRREPQSAA